VIPDFAIYKGEYIFNFGDDDIEGDRNICQAFVAKDLAISDSSSFQRDTVWPEKIREDGTLRLKLYRLHLVILATTLSRLTLSNLLMRNAVLMSCQMRTGIFYRKPKSFFSLFLKPLRLLNLIPLLWTTFFLLWTLFLVILSLESKNVQIILS
jgi:hypothetical protein